MTEKLLPLNIYTAIAAAFDPDKITEIRIRLGKPVTVSCGGSYKVLTMEGQPLNASRDDIDTVIAVASENSVYAVNDAMKKCFLYYGAGIRIGLSGEGVLEDGKMTALKNVTGLCVRIPHQVFGCLGRYAAIAEEPANTLIISVPAAGKTTMLRELARLSSDNGYNTLILDERREIAAVADGKNSLDVGMCSDVLSVMPKKDAYEHAIRALNPQIVVTDEIFGKQEASAVADISRCGVVFYATVHSDGIESLLNSEYEELLYLARYVFVLDKYPRAGTVKSFVDTRRERLCSR